MPATTTETYKINPEGFKALQNKVLMRSIPITMLALIFGLGFSVFNSDRSLGAKDIPLFITIAVFVPVVLYFSLQRQFKMLKTYTIIFDESGITRQQLNTPDIFIAYSDIRKILKTPDGYGIRGLSATQHIGIPRHMEDFQFLEARINELPVEITVKKNPVTLYTILASLFGILLMGTLYISQDKTIVAITGSLLVVLLLYSGFTIWKYRKLLDKRIMIMLWFYPIVLLSIISVMYYKLTGKL